MGQQLTAEWERYKKFWQRRHFTPIADHLTTPWRERYQAIVSELGPEEPESDGGLSGPNSPITKEELSTMAPQVLVEYLATWRPTSNDEFKPSRAGIGLDLKSIIGNNPTTLDTVIEQLRVLNPTYVRSYYYGLRDAPENGRPVTWQLVLDLARWVVNEPTANNREYDHFDDDTTWASTRSAIGDVLDVALTKATNKKTDEHDALPIVHRDTVWHIISVLAQDLDPTPALEASYGKDMDASLLAINTTRGKAIEGVIAYALWVRHHQSEPNGFASMPEVREALDQHLANDPSVAIRSVMAGSSPGSSSSTTTGRPATSRTSSATTAARPHGTRTSHFARLTTAPSSFSPSTTRLPSTTSTPTAEGPNDAARRIPTSTSANTSWHNTGAAISPSITASCNASSNAHRRTPVRTP